MAKDDELMIKWGFEPDTKTQDATKNAFKNMISLVADLSIIGKIASEALSGVWSAMKTGIDVGIESFKDMNIGVALGIDASELEKLKFIMGQIGASGKDTMSLVTQINELVRSFNAPGTGAGQLKEFHTAMGTYNVDEELKDKLVASIKDEDVFNTALLMGELREVLGERFSDITNTLNISGLQTLESDLQWDDWNEAIARAAKSFGMFNIDEKGLNDLSDGMRLANDALRSIAIDIGEDLGKPMKIMGDYMYEWANSYLEWKDKGGWGQLWGKAKELAEDIPTFKQDETESIASRLFSKIKEYNAGLTADYDAMQSGRSGFGDDPLDKIPLLDAANASGGAPINVGGDLILQLPEDPQKMGDWIRELINESNQKSTFEVENALDGYGSGFTK